MSRRLPVTVLAWEGPQSRAYLVRMRRAGLRPERIVMMIAQPFKGTRQITASPRRKPGILLRWAERIQDWSRNHHPYQIRKKHPRLVQAITEAVAPIVDDPMAFYTEMYAGFSYDRYADEVVRVPANAHNDPQFVDALRTGHVGTALFTGGGIVPPAVFAIPGIRLIHVHTGFLPHVRGADVLLWSLLVRGRPGVSAFVMTPGLDDGDILASRELAPLQVPLSDGKRIDDETLYRALFSFIDPVIRAEFLVSDVLERADDVSALPTSPQDPGHGVTYHFMHPDVRRRALRMLFPSPPPSPGRSVGGPAAKTESTERYARYYNSRSIWASPRFAFDALQAPTPLRALSLQNRRKDYVALATRPDRLSLHAEFNHHLGLQAAFWPAYDYGEGWFYQSSDELGITGLRDTLARINAFGLCDVVVGRTVLEIGCNTGFLALAIATSAAQVVAFDVNPHLIAIAQAGQRFVGRTNVTFSACAFEDFATDQQFDVVLSLANHHTYDGNMRQSLEEYFARCHALTKAGGRLVFESHPPALEGNEFGQTLDILERSYAIERSEVHDYGTFLDKGRRFLVATRR